MNDKTSHMVENLKERKTEVKETSKNWWNKLNLSDRLNFKNNRPQYIWGSVGAVTLIGAGVAYQMLRKK